MQNEMAWFQKKQGVKKLVKAVEIKRHILVIHAKGVNDSQVTKAETAVDAVLNRAGVAIPADLSFSH